MNLNKPPTVKILFSVNEKVLLIGRGSEIRGVDIEQPYYHTIPTISSPAVQSPVKIEYLARNNTLYWADSQSSEIKRSGLTHGPSVTLIDTGVQHPTGLAVDWLSNIMFVSSFAGISVCNLDGEYSTSLIKGNVHSVAILPSEGRLFWISEKADKFRVETSLMDGSSIMGISNEFDGPVKSLTVDGETKRLYWISDFEIFYTNYNVTEGNITKLKLLNNYSVSAATIYKDYIFYADDDDQSVHRANKMTGLEDITLRNGTGDILSLRIYDPTLQKGSHPCGANKGKCQHLCLPSSSKTYTCKCATGYKTDPKDPTKCVSIQEFLFYSVGWEIRGLPLDGNNETHVLGPISRVSMANAIEYIAAKDLIIWADSDHCSVTRINRDGTDRAFVIEQPEVMDSVSVDWLTSIAVDWVAGNIFWSDSKRGVIEVARLDGSNQHVLLSNEVGKPASIAVDPIKGVLVWSLGSRVEIATMAGQGRRLLLDSAKSISDVTLDAENEFIYFCDTVSNTIERIKYDGTGYELLLNASIENPVGVTVYEDKIYWIDT